MKILVISDIHANLYALEAVLESAGEIDAAWCLGDLVGYGPDPNECVSRVRQLPHLTCIIGNHDAAALQQIDDETFNPEARTAIQWTRNALTHDTITFLNNLPEKNQNEKVTLAHGSPRHPVWEYLLDIRTATLSFDYFSTQYCFVGHTHLPVVYIYDEINQYARLVIPEAEKVMQFEFRAIMNPGSVGQPRDRDPRASFAIFDSDEETWVIHRVSYDIVSTQLKMEKAGLPDRHIQRLAAGW